ncbi:GNAT family N-acetyltransferase [uncultured Tateyamaria sp.]|uniref:GNAT family N-acetyltransferase n=1 Tax=Tateyamaria sp. 1078 TaxID=3417464 RepID=UPI002613AEF5|nr:GNAT family N-acetyltransferase [uncultured Tateyamaria sp.]
MKDFSDLNLRPAHTGDAVNLAKFIDTAGEGIPRWLWAQSAKPEQCPLDYGISRAKRDTGGFSYKNAILAERFGEAVGMALSYPIQSAPEGTLDDLPLPVIPFVALERLSVGTWYVNALAVTPAARGFGVGTALMGEVERIARRQGFDRLSIQVYAQNHGALRLYQRLGYSLSARSPVLLHPCPPYYTGDVLLLEKQLPETTASAPPQIATRRSPA